MQKAIIKQLIMERYTENEDMPGQASQGNVLMKNGKTMHEMLFAEELVNVELSSWDMMRLNIVDQLMNVENEKQLNAWNNDFILNISPGTFTKDQLKHIAMMVDERKEQLNIPVE